MRKKAREYYIIDGYNVINSWPELIKLRDNLSEARDMLVHMLLEYGAYEKYVMTVVFDALFTDDEEHIEVINPQFNVVYTGMGETADSYIERRAYEAVQQGQEVHVVTSDGAEQSMILGAGAYRHPSKEFHKIVKATKKDLRKRYLDDVKLPVSRNEIGNNLDSETMAKLDALRKNK
ncbi:MAG: NYN domain-containing protein [Anaerovibrio sp.]|uniref:NYN domain-containing protein n=1 Tax=Anaerovibrio sp. TaxID=1872532 RepID=UPI0025D1B51B|nr:NYN domain-containing protein [Anaerovibrio sp.]MCR5176451.1 NYN domain-containing protein [Anaerovibrio sp.]